MSFVDVLARVREFEVKGSAGLTPVSVAFLRDATLEGLAPYLKLFCFCAGLFPEIRFNAFGDRLAGVESDPLWINFTPEIAFVTSHLPAVSPALCESFMNLSEAERRSEADRAVGEVLSLTDAAYAKGARLVVAGTFENPRHPPLGVADVMEASGQSRLIEEMNRRLVGEISRRPGARVLDLRALVSRLGEAAFYDDRNWHLARAPYAREGLKSLAWEAAKFVRAFKGKARKCLVLDCDNTLWDGIVGEEGPHGVRVGGGHPGSVHAAFQRQILNLRERGVVLALNSRNNEADVLAVLRDHPGMVLRESHFAARRINWKDKVENLRELSAELNLPLDQMAFVDDNPFEVGMVREMLPEVEALLLPEDRPAITSLLPAYGGFDALSFSAEDRRRGDSYAARAAAESEKARFGSVDEYLSSLGMRVSVIRADDYAVPRATQLSQKTNQFNLTTRRYGEAEIRDLSRSPDAAVLCASLCDRIGDHGLTGVVVLKFAGDAAVIEAFFVSCRVIGRKLEDVLLEACRREALRAGARRLEGVYRPTAKNALVADFYAGRGFAGSGSTPEGGRRFELDVTAAKAIDLSVFHRVEFA